MFLKDDQCFNKSTGARIRACLPMHTFGHPCHIVEILEICEEFYLKLVEDSAESLGSTIFNKHTGTFGEAAAFSFNGNKIITTGGGGMVITNDEKISVLARHLSATAKTSHEYEYFHDQVGFNYRMPNLNAVLGLSQLEKMEKILLVKRRLTDFYNQFFESQAVKFISAIDEAESNNWLNGIILPSRKERDIFLKQTNHESVFTRPIWNPLNRLPMYSSCECAPLTNTYFFEERVVNIPSSVPTLDWRD